MAPHRPGSISWALPSSAKSACSASAVRPRAGRCDGSLLQISEYEPLYVLLGTAYGGNGTSTFGVPDLRGRLPIHQGQGPGLSNRSPSAQAPRRWMPAPYRAGHRRAIATTGIFPQQAHGRTHQHPSAGVHADHAEHRAVFPARRGLRRQWHHHVPTAVRAGCQARVD
ncbi:phage tail protein [Pantoea ananatis]|uniref:phage tail protein n=1 Tax=Pantoea ananas TaxID=553 RepID=UPI0039B8FC89